MPERIRVLRVIARLNIGGPAYHVSILSGRLDPERYETLLVAGRPGPGEGSFEDLAREYGARFKLLAPLGPTVDPLADWRALAALRSIVRRFRPHIVHTHTAKAGALGRTAALLAGRPRPRIVHTYHGHVLDGQLGPAMTGALRGVERVLGRYSDRLIGVSQATVDDLVRLRVAPPERFAAIPLGLDLERFLALDPPAGRDHGEVTALFAARLAAVKRPDVLLRALARARTSGAALRLIVLGDGDLRPDLERLARELGIAPAVSFLGYRTDITPQLAAADIAVLSSSMEGTPVALIEAGAAARPLISTRVGGVEEVVVPGTGRLVENGDVEGLAAALVELAGDPLLRHEMGARAREHVRGRYRAERLLADIDALYQELLSDGS
jgi:glycosyltransferase involved in cell wall biosynthesis